MPDSGGISRSIKDAGSDRHDRWLAAEADRVFCSLAATMPVLSDEIALATPQSHRERWPTFGSRLRVILYRLTMSEACPLYLLSRPNW